MLPFAVLSIAFAWVVIDGLAERIKARALADRMGLAATAYKIHRRTPD